MPPLTPPADTSAAVGAEHTAAPPKGRFVLADNDREIVAFAGERIHLERFTPVAAPAPETNGAAVTEEVTIELGRTTVTQPYRAGNTLLQTARLAGLNAPSSCETGSCGTCMAQVTEGSARMLNNDALDDDEVAEGWVVTCQALPTSPTVRVVYE